VASIGGPEFTADELAAIDEHARDGGLNIWAASSEA
jgi:L-glyceraldehyde 3-phosphate reductase